MSEALHPAHEIAKQATDLKAVGPRRRIYLLEKLEQAPEAPTLNRIGGSPPGLTEEAWPQFDDEPMEHLFTLDLETMPELRKLPGLDTARAAALFVSSADHNEAYEPFNDETVLVPLTQAQVDTGALAEPPAGESSETHFIPVPVEVPEAIFDDDLEENSDLHQLRGAIYQYAARVLGEPIWLQSDEHGGDLVMQFDENFVDINLGDVGVMYVFPDTQFWQCH